LLIDSFYTLLTLENRCSSKYWWKRIFHTSLHVSVNVVNLWLVEAEFSWIVKLVGFLLFISVYLLKEILVVYPFVYLLEKVDIFFSLPIRGDLIVYSFTL